MGKTEKRIVEYPCLKPLLVSVDKVQANDYNPNKMSNKMFNLLKKSILEDGLTMPIVTFYDKGLDKYIIVDGFHRYTVLKRLHCTEIPVVVIDKDISERRISTIRHNKAKGTHQLELVKDNFNALINEGEFSLAEISEKLALESEEVVIYKKKGSVVEEFREQEFSNSWERNKEQKILYKNKTFDEYGED